MKRVLLALLLGAAASSALVREARASAAPDSAHAPLLTRRDAWFALGTGAAVAVAFANDRHATEEAIESRTQTERDLARFAEHLGNTAVVAPALVVTDLALRASGRSAAGAVTERLALSVGVAGVGALAIKQAAGRVRPDDSPDDNRVFKPFSGNDAFPSGHTTVAFALAGALGEECHARWLPYVTYPAAAMVGWSRVRDDKHWLSDVVAGAAYGWWTARKTDQLARRHLPDGLWVLVFPQRGGATAKLGARF